MQKLISELSRLYLPPGSLSADALAPHLHGLATLPVRLTSDAGMTKSLVIDFHKVRGAAEEQHWTQLCIVANALQNELGLPAPAVSISGDKGYGLWLSFETPVPKAIAQRFLELLQHAYFPDVAVRADAVDLPVELPPCLHLRSGKWAAFIHPGMGASFADESGLEMPPPFAGQAAFLEKLEGITREQLQHAMGKLDQGQAAPNAAPQPEHAAVTDDTLLTNNPLLRNDTALRDDILLRDATLEDIVRYLHAKRIEPTFRHLMPDS